MHDDDGVSGRVDDDCTHHDEHNSHDADNAVANAAVVWRHWRCRSRLPDDWNDSAPMRVSPNAARLLPRWSQHNLFLRPVEQCQHESVRAARRLHGGRHDGSWILSMQSCSWLLLHRIRCRRSDTLSDAMRDGDNVSGHDDNGADDDEHDDVNDTIHDDGNNCHDTVADADVSEFSLQPDHYGQ